VTAGPAASRARPKRYDVSVFVNCPFDEAYRPLLQAVLFTIHDCGFMARLALEDTGSGETRLDKIARIIKDSRFSIHDISRTEAMPATGLPRFNMPFECGLAFGAMHFAPNAAGARRDALILAAQKFEDKATLSDLAGQDAAYHANDPGLAIKAVRGFLAAKAKSVLSSDVMVRGDSAITKRFARFNAELPALALAADISTSEIASFGYVADWLSLAAAWQVESAR